MRKFVILLLTFLTLAFGSIGQATYNSCDNAYPLCPQQQVNLTNVSANVTLCGGCEDDFTFCFSPQNSIWMSFTTNETGGTAQVTFTNLDFVMETGRDQELHASILSMSASCLSVGYTQLGNCVNNISTDFILTANGLAANTTYYVVLSGALDDVGITLPAEASFDVLLTGNGVTRPVPEVFLNSGATDYCLNDVVEVMANTQNCPDYSTFRWYINGILVSTTSDSTFTTSLLQDGDIISVQTDCYSFCPVTVSDNSTTFSIYSFPIDAGEDFELLIGESQQLNASTTADTFFWSPSISISNVNILNPIVFPTQTTTYMLTATQNGCTLYDQLTVTVESNILITNTFSPNGDGQNDKWIIDGIESYPNNILRIYNRWGQPVFESSGYSKSTAWDGTSKGGGKLQEGVYFYMLELRDADKQVLKGNVTLIR